MKRRFFVTFLITAETFYFIIFDMLIFMKAKNIHYKAVLQKVKKSYCYLNVTEGLFCYSELFTFYGNHAF
jgi:hypothetical protein